MLAFISNFFTKKQTQKNSSDKSIEKALGAIDAIHAKYVDDTEIPNITYPKGFDPNIPTVIFLDDNTGAAMLFERTAGKFKETNEELSEGIQFLSISTSHAVFILENEIERGNLKNIVGALLDITFGGHAVKEGRIRMLDGIDAYKLLKERFPDCAIRFYTAHSMNEKNAEIYKFMKKYKEMSGEDIEDVTYIKDPFSNSREEALMDILKEVKEKNVH